ncbi:unnamed protein product [Calypogeia fissa]
MIQQRSLHNLAAKSLQAVQALGSEHTRPGPLLHPVLAASIEHGVYIHCQYDSQSNKARPMFRGQYTAREERS